MKLRSKWKIHGIFREQNWTEFVEGGRTIRKSKMGQSWAVDFFLGGLHGSRVCICITEKGNILRSHIGGWCKGWAWVWAGSWVVLVVLLIYSHREAGRLIDVGFKGCWMHGQRRILQERNMVRERGKDRPWAWVWEMMAGEQRRTESRCLYPFTLHVLTWEENQRQKILRLWLYLKMYKDIESLLSCIFLTGIEKFRNEGSIFTYLLSSSPSPYTFTPFMALHLIFGNVQALNTYEINKRGSPGLGLLTRHVAFLQ